MQQYLDLLKDILENGEERMDRTGTGTKSLFARHLRFDLQKGFPLVTTKKMGIKSISSELLWFLEGSCDERRLAEIQYGTRDSSKRTIWTENALADYWLPYARFLGDLGRIYGVQWRKWRSPTPTKLNHDKDYLPSEVPTYIDQIKNIIEGLKKDPYSRRHLVIAYNPSELNQMALPPCHIFFQFWVSSDKKLSCQFYMRSNDVPLGLPYNIASYALLTHMVAQVTDLAVGELIVTIGDAHIYLDQVDIIHEQLKREPYELPTLVMDPNIKDIDHFTLDSIELLNYNHHPKLEIPFSV